MKTLFHFIIVILMLCTLSACEPSHSAKTKIGIVLPLEHKALQEIVAGFTNKLHSIYKEPVQIKIMNAQGDVNMQRAIIQQLHDQNYTLVVPVATGVTEMTVAMIHDKPVIALAADFTEEDRKKLHPCHVAVVDDEIPAHKILAFIHAAYPTLTQLTLIHSTADKILPEVKTTIVVGKENGITVKPLMVATLPELVSTMQALPANTQGIFILKDNLIASGIATLIQTANKKHIPLITSDQGTVLEGAGFGIGVHERQIGEEGATIAADVLNGKPICDIPIKKMEKLTVFLNKKALQQEQQDIEHIIVTALKFHYAAEIFERK